MRNPRWRKRREPENGKLPKNEVAMMQMLPSVPGGNSATARGAQLCITKIRTLSQASHFTLLQHARSGAAPSFSTTAVEKDVSLINLQAAG